jgi:translocator protein
MKKSTLFLNLLAFIAMVSVNVLANALPLNGLNTGEVSGFYPSLFTPSGFTFSIWSVIYLLLAGFVIYSARDGSPEYVVKVCRWFWLSCLLNASWIFAWHYLMPLLSVCIMVVFLLVLTKIFLIVKERRAQTKVEYTFIQLPFAIYLGWICVATIANISAWLVSVNWSGGPVGELAWTVIMMAVATALSIIVLQKFKEWAFGAVTIWAFFGIAMKGLEVVTPAAIALILLLMIAGVLMLFRGSKKFIS